MLLLTVVLPTRTRRRTCDGCEGCVALSDGATGGVADEVDRVGLQNLPPHGIEFLDERFNGVVGVAALDLRVPRPALVIQEHMSVLGEEVHAALEAQA